MTTPVKVGARNDLFALKQARQYTASAVTTAEKAIDELARMRDAVGRPDYGRMHSYLSQLAIELAKTSKAQDEMWVIRELAGQTVDAALAARLADVEAQLAELMQLIGERVR